MTRNKKAQEQDLLVHFLECLGEHPDRWTVEKADERPDFTVLSPVDDRIGVEITELLSTLQGRDRAADGRVAAVIKREVSGALRCLGGSGGAIVDGTTTDPWSGQLDHLKANIHAHLAKHADALRNDGGVLEERIRHACGEILHVERCDKLNDVLLLESRYPSPLAYKAPKPLGDIENALIATVAKKAGQATDYDQSLPLWLAIRNPNQRIATIGADTTAEIREVNGGRFQRIVVFNMPQDIDDPCPPEPRHLDLFS